MQLQNINDKKNDKKQEGLSETKLIGSVSENGGIISLLQAIQNSCSTGDYEVVSLS